MLRGGIGWGRVRVGQDTIPLSRGIPAALERGGSGLSYNSSSLLLQNRKRRWFATPWTLILSLGSRGSLSTLTHKA